MAFKPIVNITDASVFAREALVRGTDGRGTGGILGMICQRSRHAFDQACRVKPASGRGWLAPCSLAFG